MDKDQARRIEAGYAEKVISLDGSDYYPSTRYGCEEMARWCLQVASEKKNKYEVWQWQMKAAKWYKYAANDEIGKARLFLSSGK